MKLVKITRESLGSPEKNTEPSITFFKNGLIVLSKRAVTLLKIGSDIKHPGYIQILFDEESDKDFYIHGGGSYRVRYNNKGAAMFNCTALCKLVMFQSWSAHGHPAGAEMPKRVTLYLCNKPVDDDKNKNIFALLRKKP